MIISGFWSGLVIAVKITTALGGIAELQREGLAGAGCDRRDMFMRGEGVSQDYQRALAWYRKAARRDCLLRKRILASCLHLVAASL